jgi:hypothetical protein
MPWRIPAELPDLRRAGIVALDIETRDDRLRADMGSGWPFKTGYICGVSVAYRADGEVRAHYFPICHPDSNNFDPALVYQWLRDLIASDVRFVTQNGLYDWGWLRAGADIRMPPAERLEEIGALATMVDENRFKYSLDPLCAWRGLPGKDEAPLLQGIETLGLIANKRKKIVPQEYLWQLPAHYVGAYAEADAANTLTLFESLDPILDQEGTRGAYRLEVIGSSKAKDGGFGRHSPSTSRNSKPGDIHLRELMPFVRCRPKGHCHSKDHSWVLLHDRPNFRETLHDRGLLHRVSAVRPFMNLNSPISFWVKFLLRALFTLSDHDAVVQLLFPIIERERTRLKVPVDIKPYTPRDRVSAIRPSAYTPIRH